MKKKILILGAGVYQVPLIKKAKDLGLQAIVTSTRGKYPGIELADIFLDVDTTNIDGIINVAEKYLIDAVLTTGTDVAIPTIGAVVDKLNLPGTGYIAACKSMNKVLMKKAFLKHNVPTALFKIIENELEARRAAEEIGFPVIIKAVDSSGSRGTTKVDTIKQISNAWERAVNVTHSPEVIVEKYLKGIEYGAQAIIHGNEAVKIFLHNDTVTPPPYSAPIGHSIPVRLPENIQEKTKEIIRNAIYSLGIRDTIANVDMILVDDIPMMIEIGARMGATGLPENISIYGGFDAYEHIIRLSLGEKPTLNDSIKQPNASLLLRSNKTGTVKSIDIPETIFSHPRLYELGIDVEPGSEVKAFEVGPDRIGNIIVTGNSAEEAEFLARELADKIRLYIRT